MNKGVDAYWLGTFRAYLNGELEIKDDLQNPKGSIHELVRQFRASTEKAVPDLSVMLRLAYFIDFVCQMCHMACGRSETTAPDFDTAIAFIVQCRDLFNSALVLPLEDSVTQRIAEYVGKQNQRIVSIARIRSALSRWGVERAG